MGAVAIAQVCPESRGEMYTSFHDNEPLSRPELDAELTGQRVRTLLGIAATVSAFAVGGFEIIDAAEKYKERPAVVYKQDAFKQGIPQPESQPRHFSPTDISLPLGK